MRVVATTAILGVALLPSVRAYAAQVCNAGYPGENSKQILQRFPQAIAACPHPSTVVIFVGMNDAANGKRLLPPEQTRENVTALLQAVIAAHARPLLVTVHQPDLVRLMQRHQPAEYGDRTPAQRIDELNLALRAAAAQTGTLLVDFAATLAAAGGATTALSTDGVHLTAEGYRLLAQTVFARMGKVPADAKVLCLGDSLTYGIGVRRPDTPDVGSESYPQQLSALLNKTL